MIHLEVDKETAITQLLLVTFLKSPSRSPSSFPSTLICPQEKEKLSLMEVASSPLSAALDLLAVEVEMEMSSRFTTVVNFPEKVDTTAGPSYFVLDCRLHFELIVTLLTKHTYDL